MKNILLYLTTFSIFVCLGDNTNYLSFTYKRGYDEVIIANKISVAVLSVGSWHTLKIEWENKGKESYSVYVDETECLTETVKTMLDTTSENKLRFCLCGEGSAKEGWIADTTLYCVTGNDDSAEDDNSGSGSSLVTGTLTVDENGTASFSSTEALNGVLIVAAYNKSGALEKGSIATIAVSGTNASVASEVTAAYMYKAFLFESLTSATPLLPSVFIVSEETSFSEGQIYNLTTTFIGDAKTSRGFTWSSAALYTNMAIEYAPAGADWQSSKQRVMAECELYDGVLYYHADIISLAAGTEYAYRVGDISYNKWSEIYNFTTEAENVSAFSFLGVADSHIGHNSDSYPLYESLIDTAFEETPNIKFIVHLGDMVSGGANVSQWNDYFSALKGHIEKIPHMSVIGNHECSGDATTAAKYYALLFNNPDNGRNALENITADNVSSAQSKGAVNNFDDSVYSFDYGNVHFAVLNTGYHLTSTDIETILNAEKEWLKKDLGNSTAKWKILMLHQGIYSARKSSSNTRNCLSAIIDEFDVDLVLQGHDHFVMRTHPIKDGEIVTNDENAAIYIILGAAGSKRYEDCIAQDYSSVHINPSAELPTYTIFNVDDSKIEIVTKQLDGITLDSYTIIKQ